MQTIVHDKVTEQLLKFVKEKGEKVILATLKEHVSEQSPIIYRPSLDVSNYSYEKALKDLNYFSYEIEKLCKANILWRFFTLYRKLLRAAFIILNKVYGQKIHHEHLSPIFEQSILFATNSIVKFTKNEYLNHCNDKYTFHPSEKELEDALRLMTLSLLHRHQVFFLNSIIRRNFVSEVVFYNLLEIYNRRLKLKSRVLELEPDYWKNDIIIIPSFIASLPNKDRLLTFKDSNDDEHMLAITNFFSMPFNADQEKERFSFIDKNAFLRMMGHDTETFWKIWIALNTLLKESLANFWGESIARTLNPDVLRGGLERADDYSETGFGCAVDDSIVQGCFKILVQKYKYEAPSLEDCKSFVDYFTCGQLERVDFIEQPYLFYRVGTNRLFWDYMRHGGLIRALARKVRAKSGDKYEDFVMRKIKEEVVGVSGLESDIVVKQKKEVRWQIDIGFVVNKILFLVEVKYRFKSIPYHMADPVDFSNRIETVEGFLTKQDKNHQRYRHEVWEKWRDLEFHGSICVVCTEEAEFICSLDKTWWLSLNETPRICMFNELIAYINKEDLTELYQHPHFAARG